ncbi:MAG: sensor histidine kinase [Candidatus Nitrosotenuis sp.]
MSTIVLMSVGLTTYFTYTCLVLFAGSLENTKMNGLEQHQITIMMIAALTSMAGILGALFISNGISKPIRKLQQAAKNVESGNFETINVMHTSAEFTDLTNSFNSMIHSLKKTVALEAKLAIAEERLKTEKLVTIGEIASRLAHDIRNPLTVIKSTVEILQLKNNDEKVKEKLDRMTRASDTMKSQIDGVMDFVRTKSLDLAIVSTDQLFDSVKQTLEIPEGIVLSLPNEHFQIPCDQRKMETLFVNLITNAVQAIGEKGHIQLRLIDQFDKLLIEVEDSGPGIKDDDFPRIFEPLFTTKQEGTGLGLSTCKNIVEQHGGTISAYNNPTRFVVKLPKYIASEIKQI